jgi:guanine deaminase
VAWVKTLFPESASYTDVYVKHQLYGPEKTLMAHSIYLDSVEMELAKSAYIYMVHCPNSNMNLSSGIMPVTQFLDEGITVGLGSDIGSGHTLAMQQTITSAIQCSKIRHVLSPKERILSEPEAFHMATKVNGSFFESFGLIGSFETGYQFDALVIKDPSPIMDTLKPVEQLQRFLYCGWTESIQVRYLNGKNI